MTIVKIDAFKSKQRVFRNLLPVSIFPLQPISRRLPTRRPRGITPRHLLTHGFPPPLTVIASLFFVGCLFLCFSHEHYCLGDVSSSLLLLPLLSSGGDVNNRLPRSGVFPTGSLTCGRVRGLLRSLQSVLLPRREAVQSLIPSCVLGSFIFPASLGVPWGPRSVNAQRQFQYATAVISKPLTQGPAPLSHCVG